MAVPDRFNRNYFGGDYFRSVVQFLPCDREADILPVRHQFESDCCKFFAFVTCVTAAVRSKYHAATTLSVQQLCTVLGRGASIADTVSRISTNGLVIDQLWPWTGLHNPVAPNLDLDHQVYRANIGRVTESEFTRILRFRPIFVCYWQTPGALAWAAGGFNGIFSYLENELESVLYTLATTGRETIGHAVTIVGYGAEEEQLENGDIIRQPYYIAQDSFGLDFNLGYRKFDPSVFFGNHPYSGGRCVNDVEKIEVIIERPGVQQVEYMGEQVEYMEE